MTDPISLAPLPAPLTWDVRPTSWNVGDGPELTIAAPPRSDLFVDPAGSDWTASQLTWSATRTT